jgi:sugar lactone lactonase YvrE
MTRRITCICALAFTLAAAFAVPNALAVSGKDTITNFAGIGGSCRYSGDGGPAVKAELFAPAGVAADTQGNTYIADTFNRRVRKVSPNGTITTFAGSGDPIPGYNWEGGPATKAALYAPKDLAFDANGSLYIADYGEGALLRVSRGGTITTIAGHGNSPLNGGDGGPAKAARFDEPDQVAVDSTGNVYVLDLGRIRMINPAGIITTFAGQEGLPGVLAEGGPAGKADLDSVRGMAFDAKGNLFLADDEKYRVRKIDRNGIITTVAGNGLEGRNGEGDGGPATRAALEHPVDVVVDRAGNLYIADGQRVRKVTPDGTITTIAGATPPRDPRARGDGGPASKGRLSPYHLALDGDGSLYASEGCLVRKIANLVPRPSFTLRPASGKAPLRVVFDASKSRDPDGSIVSHSWDFGDGFTASGVRTQHTFAKPGSYTVKLTVMDDSGATRVRTRTVKVG